MNLDSLTGPGSTPSRRRFWDKVTQAVIASQKVAGDNVSVDEHEGMGTLINVNPQRQGGTVATGACCDEGGCTITTEAACSGEWQGAETVCDPNPCTSPCGSDTLMLCKCGYQGFADEDDNRYFLQAIIQCGCLTPLFFDPPSEPFDYTFTYTIDPSDCSETVGFDCGSYSCDDICTFCDPPLGCFSGSGDGCPRCSDDCLGIESYHSALVPPGYGDGENWTRTPPPDDHSEVHLSNEYTTEDLITNAEAAFVDAYGDCPEGCVLNSALNEDETCVTVTCVLE